MAITTRPCTGLEMWNRLAGIEAPMSDDLRLEVEIEHIKSCGARRFVADHVTDPADMLALVLDKVLTHRDDTAYLGHLLKEWLDEHIEIAAMEKVSRL